MGTGADFAVLAEGTDEAREVMAKFSFYSVSPFSRQCIWYSHKSNQSHRKGAFMSTLCRKSAVVRYANYVSVLFGLSILFMTGCNYYSSQQSAADTRAADEAAVRKADADWVKAAQTKKIDDWVAFYADDAVVLPPNDKTVTGKESIRKPITDLLALPGLSISWTPTKVEVAKSGDLAYLYGTYQLSVAGPDGKPIDDHGKMLEIWKKQTDGNWKCIVDTWSTDSPAPMPPSK